MGRAGRPRKAGKRYDNGKLVYEPKRIPPNDKAALAQAMFGQNGTDAIGRAYEAGLLGTGNEAKQLLDAARKIAKLYWRAYQVGPIRCALSDSAGGSLDEPDHERIKRQEAWLSDVLRAVDRMGVRTHFDALVIDLNPDAGPSWLDRLIWCSQHKRPGANDDYAKLIAALDGLAMVY